MANEYGYLSTVYDTPTDTKITVKRIYQENGGKGIEIVVESWSNDTIIDVFQSLDVVLPA